MGLRTADPTPVLVTPDGWCVDPISRGRLEATLASCGADVVGVVAMRVTPGPGSSFRVAAERATTTHATASPIALDAIEAHGAVLLRPGVPHDIDRASVRVPRGRLVIDAGATSHDPWRPIGSLEDASPLGRPPFPWRPVVAFVGSVHDVDLADWVRRTANGLVRRSTEGRVAVPAPTPGLYLTTPCTPTRTSVQALSPDVVVALDSSILEAAPGWLGADRSALLIELTHDTTESVELVSWRIGVAKGRLRARIGRGIQPDVLEELVRRLCAGPQALPPVEGHALAVRSTRPRRSSTASAPTVAVLSGARDRSRTDELAEHLQASVELVDHHMPRPAAISADVLLLRGVSQVAGVEDLVDARRSARLHTIVDVGAEDLVARHHDARGGPALVDTTARLLAATGRATTISLALRDALLDRGVRSLVLPHLVTEAHHADLRRLRDARRAVGPPILGWHTGHAPEAARVDSPATVVRDLLARWPQLTVEIVGNNIEPASGAVAGPTVALHPGEPGLDTVARWTAQIWMSPISPTGVDEDHSAIIHAHLMGVPSFAWSGTSAAREGLVPRSLTVEPGPCDGWRCLEAVLTDGSARRELSEQVIQLAVALYGPAAAASATNRFLGWVRHGP